MPNYNDWEIAVEHRRVITDNWPVDIRVKQPEIRKTIEGLNGKRISDGVRSGMWMKPLGSQSGMQFSSVHDVMRSTLILFVSGSSTGQSDGVTDYQLIRDLIRELFHDRRGTCLQCETVSRVRMGDYDVDDAISRQYDVDQLIIDSTFREDRIYGVH